MLCFITPFKVINRSEHFILERHLGKNIKLFFWVCTAEHESLFLRAKGTFWGTFMPKVSWRYAACSLPQIKAC